MNSTNPFYGKFDQMASALAGESTPLTFADFFCGIGGFHVAAANLGMKCVFASDIDEECRKAYHANFGLMPKGDIAKIKPDNVPDHDLLFGGFPCQPFSIIGKKKGFDDPRGTLFFDLLKIIKTKKPSAVVLENVKQLATAQQGEVIKQIVSDLEDAGYDVQYKVLNALNFGLPQKRERVLIVGLLEGMENYEWPSADQEMKPLSEILDKSPDDKFYVSERIRLKRIKSHTPRVSPSIWHENKAGNISSYPYSCALRAGASYNYLLVDGERRLAPRECLRLQGFPDTYKLVCPDAQIKKQTGNAVPVPMVQAVVNEVKRAIIKKSSTQRESTAAG